MHIHYGKGFQLYKTSNRAKVIILPGVVFFPDINECSDNSSCINSDCINQNGTYACGLCYAGFNRAVNNSTAPCCKFFFSFIFVSKGTYYNISMRGWCC